MADDQDQGTRYDMPSMSAQLNARFDVRSPAMIWYMISDDKLDSLEGGAEALELTFFGAALAFLLTVVGIAVPLYLTGMLGRIFWTCMAMIPFFLGSSLYLGLKGLRIRRQAKSKIKQIRDNSKTVIEMVAKQPLS